MAEHVMNLAMPILGWKPYMLLEFYPGPDSDDDIRCSVQVGGGMGQDDIGTGLALALSGLPDADNPFVEGLARYAAEFPDAAETVTAILEWLGWHS